MNSQVLLLMNKMYIEIKGNSFDNRIMFIYIMLSIKLFFVIRAFVVVGQYVVVMMMMQCNFERFKVFFLCCFAFFSHCF